MSHDFFRSVLGTTTDGDIVTCCLDINSFHKEPYVFSASFAVLTPISEAMFPDMLHDTLTNTDESILYHACEEYDCTPKQLVDNILDNEDDLWDWLDLDCCAGIDYVRNRLTHENYYFSMWACGQHDTRDDMDLYVNKEVYDLVIELWDKYHLKPLDDEGMAKFRKVKELLFDVIDEDWVQNFIEGTL